MNLKYSLKVSCVFFITLLQISCSSDDDLPNQVHLPEIQNLEVGVNDNRIAYIGSDLHIEAEIFAENQIKTVDVIISNESQSWILEKNYTEFLGQRNALFHKHIDIDSNAEPGIYKFKFTVTDQIGNESVQGMEIELKLIEDEIPPMLNIINSPENGKIFYNGEMIQILGNASDNNSLNYILVTLVKTDDNIPDQQITPENTIVMAEFLDLQGNDFYDFNAEIEVGNSMDNATNPKPVEWENGNYNILVIAQDLNGNKTYSNHYEIVLN